MKFKFFMLPLFILIIIFIWGNSFLAYAQSIALTEKFVLYIKNIFDNIEFLNNINSNLTFVRKIAHFTEFTTLGIILYSLFSPKTFQGFANIIFAGLSIAFIDESIQLFSLGRTSSISDMWIDIVGFLIGVFISYSLHKIIRALKRHKI